MSSRIRMRKRKPSMRAALRTRKTLQPRWVTTLTCERTEMTWRMTRAEASSKSMPNRVGMKSNLLLWEMID